VKAYQARLGLRATGVVDGWTAYRLGVGPNPSPKPVKPVTQAKVAPPYAKPGDSGARVQAVQVKLGVHPATGFYGVRTAAAVRAYQSHAHLPVTGVVDTATAVRLGLAR
jgi:peptidoglycan hydrolase-like protein with peptidoglycan-binding domain